MNHAAGSLMRDWRIGLLGISFLACAVAAALIPALPQPLTYHAFADCRTFFATPNFLNVASNLPFLVAGGWGLALVYTGGGQFLTPAERLPYLVFFLGALLTAFGSAYYHLAPDNPRLVWDRLPMTLGFAGLVSAAVAERVSPRAGLLLLWPLLALGALSVLYWHATETVGRGNVIPYGLFQGWSVLVILLLLVLFPVSAYTQGRYLAWAAGWYGLAKLFEHFDAPLYRALGGLVSGHSLKHVLAALGIFAIVWQLRLRAPSIRASIATP